MKTLTCEQVIEKMPNILDGLTIEPIIIVLDNKPKAVLLSLEEYEKLTSNSLGVPMAFPDKWEQEVIAEHEKTGHLEEGIDAIPFLDELMDKE